MSRPREYYYWDIKRWLMMADRLPQRKRTKELLQAVAEVNEETLNMPNGNARMKAIKAIIFEQRATYKGMGLELNYDWRTVQNWVTAYINQVGRKAGY